MYKENSRTKKYTKEENDFLLIQCLPKANDANGIQKLKKGFDKQKGFSKREAIALYRQAYRLQLRKRGSKKPLRCGFPKRAGKAGRGIKGCTSNES